MKEESRSILGGVTVLTISGLICKVVAVLYRIPLAWLIGEDGLGTFQLVYPTYNLLLTVSSAGLPVAVSRMVSFCLAKDDPRNAHRVFRTALSILTTLGFLGTLLMIVFSPQLAQRVGDPETRYGFITIAPALLLVCTMSAFRGFLQGQQDMKPTAISQLIEQVGKVFVALPFAYVGSRLGMTGGEGINIGCAAAGALLGNSVAEGVALLYMWLTTRRRRSAFRTLPQDEELEPYTRKGLLKRLLSLAIPITLGACIVPLASFIDSGMLVNRMVDSAGFATAEARAMYGRFSGYVITLINVPTAIAIAIAMSLVPAISAAMARGDAVAIRRQSAQGVRFAFLMGLPCSVGMSLLSRPILAMIYHFPSEAALQMTADLLSMSSLTIVLFTVVQATSGILQGLRKQRIPMYTLAVGVVVKIALNYTLVGTPSIHIYGAPIASIACYTISMLPNLYFVHRYAGYPVQWVSCLLRPLAATAGMGLVIWAGQRLLPMAWWSTVLLIAAGIMVYAALAVLVKAFDPNELKALLRHRKVTPTKEEH